MTRLAVLADIHGNLPALLAVEKELKHYKTDHTLVLGDAINWGPFSKEVVKRIVDQSWSVIRGNNEFYLLNVDTPRAPKHWKNYTVLPWLKDQLSGKLQSIIAAWPDTLCLYYPDGHPIRAYHGIPDDNTDAIFPSTPQKVIFEKLNKVSESTLLLAHSHIPMLISSDRWTVINPGSVGGSVDGTITARFAVLETKSYDRWDVTFLQIPYDITPILTEFKKQRFIEKVGPIGKLIVKEFETGRLHVIPFLRWYQDKHSDEQISEKHIMLFTEDMRQEYTPPEYQDL